LLLTQSGSFNLIEMTRAINILIEAESNIKYSTHGKVLLEMAIIKMFTLENDYSIEGLILKVEALEEKIEKLDLQRMKRSVQASEMTSKSATKEKNSRQSNLNGEKREKPKMKYETYDSIHEDYKFHGDNLMKPKNKKTIEDILQKVYSKGLTIDITYQAIQKKTKVNDEISVDEELGTYFSDYDKVLEIKE
jgi:DNA polymerase-3 subunit gamma/tau